MPFCHLRLTAKKPVNSAYPKALETLGDHLRKRRLDLGLTQAQVAMRLGVDQDTVLNWETNQTRPLIKAIPRIHYFLGYCPWKPQTSLSQKIRVWREALGLSQKELAKRLGVDESAMAAWEKGEQYPAPKSLASIRAYFKSISCHYQGSLAET